MSANPNPYEPSLASLEAKDPPPGVQAGTGLQYAGFWRRFAAFWLDALIVLPLAGVAYLVGEKTRLVYLYWFVPGAVFALFYNVHLIRRYGGTPGSLLLGIRVALVDGAPVTVKAALLRYSVLFVLGQLCAVAFIMGSLAMTDQAWFSQGYLERSRSLVASAPSWYSTVTIVMQAWIWSEFITLLTNKKRRALHDFMAGTVVVRASPSA